MIGKKTAIELLRETHSMDRSLTRSRTWLLQKVRAFGKLYRFNRAKGRGS